MANSPPNPGSVPEPPPSISAAELRRRLLASTPPPMSSPSHDEDVVAQMSQATGPMSTAGMSRAPEAPGRLRMPTMPGSGGPASGEFPAVSSPGQSQAGINNRTPVGRLQGLEPATPHPTHEQAHGSGAIGYPSSRPNDQGSGVRNIPASRPHPDESPSAEVARLRSENKELRQLLDEMKHLLQEASDTEQQYATREQELLSNLTERQRQIEELSAQMQAVEEQIATGSLAPQQMQATPKSRTELEEWADELEQENARLAQDRRKFEDERRQLHEDEESTQRVLGVFGGVWAKERAMMARQETELKRLSAEIQHELEVMSRGDATHREQLQKFQRRAQDVIQGRPGPGGGMGGGPSGPQPPMKR